MNFWLMCCNLEFHGGIDMRLFLALKLPPRQARAVAALRQDRSGWRWVEEENLHLTLAFLGEVTMQQAEELDQILQARTIRPPEVTLAGIGHFGSRRPRAVWVGAGPEAPLSDLSVGMTRAARRAGIAVERRRFVPHVTIARLGATADPGEVAAFAEARGRFSLPPFTPASVTLFRSHLRPEGPIYEALADYPEAWP